MYNANMARRMKEALTDPPRKRPSKKTKELLYEAQDGCCMYCGIYLDIEHMRVDHKTPVARNGSDRISNLQILCHPCNGKKGQKTDGEFRKHYQLTPARQADGPPRDEIPRAYFNSIDKAKRAKKPAQPKKKNGIKWF